ncbi:MAG: protein phosphatase 2C domain-containing protein [Lachnospiraceae bacterium]|nr:protein phosphatase 2C domain-containing protein [Lachnospiraceae bacterium]
MITVLNRMGTFHSDNNGENQDSVSYGENERFQVISLADGVSSCDEAKCGAEIASSAITKHFLEKGDFFLSFQEKQVAEYGLSHILYQLGRQAEADSKNVTEYSSTIASVLVDQKAGKMLCFNLGDGMVLAAGDGKCRVIALPSDSSQGCCVTTTREAEAEVFVKVLDLGPTESIVICSDGAWKQMYRKNRLKPEPAYFVGHSEYARLKDFLEKQDCFDACSFVALDLRKKGRRKSA